MQPDQSAVETLKTSQDPGKLVHAAQVLAAAGDAESHAVLQKSMESASFLDLIDPPGKVATSRLNLKVWKPLRTLSENKAPTARGVIESLTESPLYLKNIDRTDLLLEASITLRPPGKKVEKFWQPYTVTKDLHAPVVQRVLLDNGSEEALKLFGKMMADNGFPETSRAKWLRSRLPRYRNEKPYLVMADRLIADKAVTEGVRVAAVDAVFDWDDEWGPLHGPDVQRPPARALAKKDARDLVRTIARTARAAMKVPKPLDLTIDAVLAELDVLDAGKTKPPPP